MCPACLERNEGSLRTVRFLQQPGPEGPETATPYNKDSHNAIGVFFSHLSSMHRVFSVLAGFAIVKRRGLIL